MQSYAHFAIRQIFYYNFMLTSTFSKYFIDLHQLVCNICCIFAKDKLHPGY
uniref:Uncharacterized protein n=1 Tax=Siphoviridae sp. ctHiz26 TaxID=2825423 RepID=A0A8S5Q5Y4_9CAUD|nr:MAG TPA: hypothetical protein [Siphoviridae sp. ctHiz26]